MNEKIIKVKPFLKNDIGQITNILQKPIKQVAVIISKKGSTRANHYHPTQIQYVYVIKGCYVSATQDIETNRRATTTLAEGCLSIIQPKIAHRMDFIEDTIFLNLIPGTRSSKKKRKDTIPFYVEGMFEWDK